MKATRKFPCDPSAIADARAFVRESLSDWPSDTREVAELLASELATNCIRHAQSEFELAINSARRIRIEVSDASNALPKPLSPAPKEPSGRGLRIVEALSRSWGVVPAAHGKTVWFTLGNGEHEPAGERRRKGEARESVGERA
jgi:anti-sigma regulatory factor (Ser/Thr protein kinase)